MIRCKRTAKPGSNKMDRIAERADRLEDMSLFARLGRCDNSDRGTTQSYPIMKSGKRLRHSLSNILKFPTVRMAETLTRPSGRFCIDVLRPSTQWGHVERGQFT